MKSYDSRTGAGRYDRRITILALTDAGQAPGGEPVQVWQQQGPPIAAAYEPASWPEGYVAPAGQFAAHTFARFETRWQRDLITPLNRVRFDGRDYNVTGVSEVGRRDGLLIDAYARADGGVGL